MTHRLPSEDAAARVTIRAALAAASGNVRRAARILGTSPPTLHRRLDTLDLRGDLRAIREAASLADRAR